MARQARERRERLSIGGQVQGVGFRPFVYRLAGELSLSGWVSNDAGGVTIEVQGRPPPVGEFIRRLRAELPPLAEITRFRQTRVGPVDGEGRFEIRPSAGGQPPDVQVTVDTAVCEDCLREMNDPHDPRHNYPFINCTNCGPRYTIVRRIPYDRPNTTMADFAMCPLCAGQYQDPSDRRFHAQPIACPVCGPIVWLVDSRGRRISAGGAGDDAIAAAADMLLAGRIVAIKGVGGFHIACRGDDEKVVTCLRRRKRRDAKPFALMAADMEQARRICEITPEAQALLTGPIRPIVLCPRRRNAPVAPSVAEGLDTLGIMLPYTPLHQLLFKAAKLPPLVMTSGNYSDEPLVKDNDEAVAQLGRIADAICLHNRPIERRLDDSVVASPGPGRVSVLRRARGYAPQPVAVGELSHAPAILAVGADLKNTVCMLAGGRAVVSEHIGDLTDARTYRHFMDVIDHLSALWEFSPEVIAADMHPQYLCTEYANRRYGGKLPIVRVQHHHAHIVSCMAAGGEAGEVIGLACDGAGYGDDGAVWGCEVLRADRASYDRLGHLRYVPLIGGDAAARQTYRPAIAALYDTFGARCAEMGVIRRLGATEDQIRFAMEMLAGGVNCPPTSSLGRWFDAVAALVGIARANQFEGQAPMRLEAAIAAGVDEAYEFGIIASGPFQIDLRAMVTGIVNDLDSDIAAGVIAAKFHNTVAAFLTQAALVARDQTRLDVVALSGGCFANRYLTGRLIAALEREGFAVLTHRNVPANDGGISLGQAVVAAARKTAEDESTPKNAKKRA